MKNKNTEFLHILLALSMALSLLLGCLSGCAKTQAPAQPEVSVSNSASQAEADFSAPAEESAASIRTQEAEGTSSVSAEVMLTAEAPKLDRQELDAETAALLDGEDHEFEQEIAYRYYHNGEIRQELADTQRNQWMSHAGWSFDDRGNGVFVLDYDTSMSKIMNYIEYTTDYGESWASAGAYSVTSWIEDIQFAGNRVVFAVGNGVTMSRHSLMYSDDLCQSFFERDTIDFAPPSLIAVLDDEEAGPRVCMDILNSESDGSVVLGWYL